MTAIPTLATLPFETLSSILDRLCQEELFSLAETCHSIRQRLLPFLYHTITFSNHPVISNSALLAAQSHGKYVKTLRFVGYAYKSDDPFDTDLWKRPITHRDGSILYVPRHDGNSDDGSEDGEKDDSERQYDDEDEHDSEEERREEEEDEDYLLELWEDWDSSFWSWGDSRDPPPRDQFPPSALALFQAARNNDNDGLLPNLETFCINFPHNYCEQADFLPLGADGMFEDLELSWDDVEKRESNFTMCRLWHNIFREISEAGGIAPRKLILENWHPRGVSTFQSQAWGCYLSQLESFEVNLIVSNPQGNRSSQIAHVKGYGPSVGCMDEFFFQHLAQLKALTIGMGGLGMRSWS